MPLQYKPQTHFFVDQALLNSALNTDNYEFDAFGPVTSYPPENNLNDIDEYRVTSFVRASSGSTEAKVFAICDGQLFIQPQESDDTKINLILKPFPSFAPIKIKYFIYRGVNKSDLIDGNNIKAVEGNSPEFLQRIWGNYISCVTEDGSPIPEEFPASLIGYDPQNQSSDSGIASYFFADDSDDSFEIPICPQGEHLGNFIGRIGLDIVLDYGDYDLEYEEQLFKFDLEFARKPEHIFDINTITSPTETKIKRYKEYIHQFIDPAAFWGSHIDLGKIKLYNENEISNSQDIYEKVVNRFQTKNNIYLYVQEERGRSFNFYDNFSPNNSFLGLENETISMTAYNTNGWPVLIKSFTQSETPIADKIKIKLSFFRDVGTTGKLHINEGLTFIRFRTYNSIRKVTYSNGAERDVENYFWPYVIADKYLARLNNYLIGSNQISVSNITIIDYIGYRKYPLDKYFQSIFMAVNIKPILTDLSGNSHSVVNDKIFLANLYEINKLNQVSCYNKVIFDEQTIETPTPSTKRRKLYVCAIQDYIYNEDIPSTTSVLSNVPDEKFFFKDHFNDSNFVFYKGQIIDGSNTIDSLTLVNEQDFKLKQFYFNLGLLEEEFNLLMYNSETVPDPIPPSPHISTEATNFSFYFDEISVGNDKDFRKFKLGLRFENENGEIKEKFPSTDVFVYTIDGFTFFTKEFSKYQLNAKTFSGTVGNFRPVSYNEWLGSFGFDWYRIGDTNFSGDSSSRKYPKILGHYYKKAGSQASDKKSKNALPDSTDIFVNGIVMQDGTTNVIRHNEVVEEHSLMAQFPNYPTRLNDNSLYSGSFITLYPSINKNGNPTIFPKPFEAGVDTCITECEINLHLTIKSGQEPSGLRIQFEKEHFSLSSVSASDTTLMDDPTDPLRLSCLEITNKSSGNNRKIKLKIKALKEFLYDKKIKVIATENGVEKIAGEMICKANDKSIRKEVKVVFVNVTTDFPYTGSSHPQANTFPSPQNGINFTTDASTLKDIRLGIIRSFNQALINVNSFSQFSITAPSNFNSLFNLKINGSESNVFQYSNNNYKDIHSDLLNTFQLQHPSRFTQNRDSCFMFFIGLINPNLDDSYNYKGTNTGGAGRLHSGLTIVMKDGIDINNKDYVPPHEFLHSMGLNHSFNYDFDGTIQFPYEHYIFELYGTDNVMDYRISNSDNKFTLLSYQKDLIRKYSKLSNES